MDNRFLLLLLSPFLILLFIWFIKIIWNRTLAPITPLPMLSYLNVLGILTIPILIFVVYWLSYSLFNTIKFLLFEF